MKFVILFLACLGLAAAASLKKKDGVAYADQEMLQKQKFLLEIVHRPQEQLMFEEWIKMGQKFIYDRSFYSHWDVHMEKFWESYKSNTLLPRGEFFGALVKTHHKQAWGLFNFFVYAKDFQTFMQNVCWARIHVNEGMFVYALTMAVIHRDDCKGLMLPRIYELFPEHFFQSKFIMEAEKFDFDVWSKLSMYEKEFNDVFYMNNKYYKDDYLYIRDWKVWQWWKLKGLDHHWYNDTKLMRDENGYEITKNPTWQTMMSNWKMWYMPVDYTRDVVFFNDHTKMSYFTEDLGWNAAWYYFNLDYSFFLNGPAFGLDKDRRGELWIHIVQQMMSRYYLERLSNGFGEIPEFSWFDKIEYGYNPELISYNGVGFSYRKNWWEVSEYENLNIFNKLLSAWQRIDAIIHSGMYQTISGETIDLRKPESIEHIGNLLQANIDSVDKYFFTYWYMLWHMHVSGVHPDDFTVSPSVFLNFETMLRDPLFYSMHKKITEIFYRFNYNFEPYTQEELYFPGVEIKNVKIEKLVTFFDLVDTDVSNLLNDKMTFVDGKFNWDKSLFGRQARLNHEPFDIDFTIQSDKVQKVAIRMFIGPKFDEYGRLISLKDNRRNFFKMDEFVTDLTSGVNTFKRSSNDFHWTIKDHTTYTELYHYVMMAVDGKFDYPLDLTERHCAFPDRLLLPKGMEKGMPVQFFFMVVPYKPSEHAVAIESDYTWNCHIGSGQRHISELPFGYPFDRSVDEYDFLVPNMYFMDAKIYHKNYLDHLQKVLV